VSFSVVVPTYNERETIGYLLEDLDWILGPSEVIVVDDDSPDGTADVVREVRQHLDTTVEVIQRVEESGRASAILTGIEVAGHETVVVMDADGQHPPERVPSLAAFVRDGADVVVGSRHADGGSIVGDWPLARRVVSRGAAGVARVTIPPARALSDPMSGFFAVRRSVVTECDDLDPVGWKALLEILAKCEVDDVTEVGYTFQPRRAGESSLSTWEALRFLDHASILRVVSSPFGRLGAMPTARAAWTAALAVGAAVVALSIASTGRVSAGHTASIAAAGGVFGWMARDVFGEVMLRG